MSVTDILVDFAIASFFIAVGQLLRAKVPLVQKFFIPPSMIAGFIALALGAQGLGILPFSENIGSYASVLIILIFTALNCTAVFADFLSIRKILKRKLTGLVLIFPIKCWHRRFSSHWHRCLVF